MRNKMIKYSNFILIAAGVLFVSCDERKPANADSSASTTSGAYKITVTAQSYGFDTNNNAIAVGEDLMGAFVTTFITAQLLDSLDQAQKEELISFSAKASGSDIGSFDTSTPKTNNDGLAVVQFSDGNVAAYDNATTPTYEGVEVTAKYTKGGTDFEAAVRFDVFDTSAVELWPYQLNLSTNTNAIKLDDGNTKAELSARINSLQYGNPISNVELFFESTNGRLSVLSDLTDSTGIAKVEFSDTGDPSEIGVSTVSTRYQHPIFGMVKDSVQITIRDTSSGIPAYIQITSASPPEIMVVGSGGSESTDICARVFDENGVLVQTPYIVTFTLGPELPEGANLNNSGIVDSAYSANGEACVSLNSGVAPGPVRVTAVLMYEGEEIAATAIPVIIATGPPANIEAEYDPLNTTPTGGGYYLTEASAMVYDLWYNPVADSTYVYWTINPILPDTLIEALVEGVSYTGNPNLNGDSYSGLAFTTIIYSTDAIGDIGYVTALTFGANGDTVSVRINEDEGETTMTFVPGTLVLSAATTYVDFTALGATTVQLDITGTLQDFYGNPVAEAPIALNAPGAANIYWPASPISNNVGITDENGQVIWVVEYDQGICAWIVGTEDPAQYEDFTSSITATLLIAQSITSDPLDILLVRTPEGP
ncbi:MAG: hypothetical protein CMG29_03805 [Candidatus Marinimicrobia bacterium]|jgi:hypothetical protein|nr:hypothetical protein [Candidatus Neomarinimicrobiota bacterium]MDP6276148.1 Ig-like domain-containing protein [Candidatus Neomarinimicrobiota bacterium]MDP7437193.1 Ig-like domain-containing protein [Candidatus Neomarinimicrobiota bacterium]|tara:strand:+ start:6926 stop:8878 length:1953 start_codon:yes stop_codon:yes gene_type:complete